MALESYGDINELKDQNGIAHKIITKKEDGELDGNEKKYSK